MGKVRFAYYESRPEFHNGEVHIARLDRDYSIYQDDRLIRSDNSNAKVVLAFIAEKIQRSKKKKSE